MVVKLDKKANWVELKVGKKELEEWRNFATKVLETVNYKGDVNTKVGEIIKEAKAGWDRCPPDFGSRVKFKIGYRRLKFYNDGTPEDYSNLTKEGAGRPPKTKSDEYQEETLNKLKDVSPLELISPSFLSSEELKFVDERKKVYNKEFEFNESSDQVLLQQVLLDELIIRRISLARLQGDEIPQSNIDKMMDRFRKNLDKLGVLRVQRLELNSDIQGNVGQLSAELDRKLDKIRKLRDKDLREELLNKIKDKLAYATAAEILQIAEEVEYQRIHELEFPANNVAFEGVLEED